MDAWRSSNSSTLYSGPFFAGELSIAPEAPEAPEPKGRVSERVEVKVAAGLRQRGAHGVSVQVMDLWLRLPGLEPCHAIVAWAKGSYVGCRFERPLHPAVLDMIVRKTKGR
jgi:hypothetical protein